MSTDTISNLTKREFLATQFLTALLSNPNVLQISNASIKLAVDTADLLIKELAKESPDV